METDRQPRTNLIKEETNTRLIPRINDVHARSRASTFLGWGPKMFAFALGTLALAATTQHALAVTETPKRSTCLVSHVAPKLADVQAPGWPTNQSTTDASGTATVQLNFDENAIVRSTSIAHSSGDFYLDQEARRLASRARFEVRAGTCMIPASYSLVIDFPERP